MTCSHMIVNWLLGSISENVPRLWTLSSKEVNHINNGMIMWNMMRCFMSEVNRVAIEKLCWKSIIFSLLLSVPYDDLSSADSELVTRHCILECTSSLNFEF